MNSDCLSYEAFAPYLAASNSVSLEGDHVAKAAEDVLQFCQQSESLFGSKDRTLEHLFLVIEEVTVDSDQELPVPATIANAINLLMTLPNDLMMPEIGVDPDGSIAFDWIVSRSRMLSISVSTSDRLAYAWLDGSDRGHAVGRLRNGKIPNELIAIMRSLIPNANFTLRAA